MAITTLDAALSGMMPPVPLAKVVGPTMLGPPWYQSLWYLGGTPSSAAALANTNGGTVLTSSTSLVQGQIYRVNPASGNAYLGRLTASASQAGTLLLCDRLLQCQGITAATAIAVTTTTAQTINTTTLPARDNTGTTSGVGVYAAVEISAAVGAGVPTLTLSYTNSSASAGKTGTNIVPVIASSPLGGFYPISLAAGDVGVQSVQTITISISMTSGNVAVVLYRILAALELSAANIPNALDALTAGFPQLFNGTVPFLVFVPSAVTATTVNGTYVETQG